MKKYYLIKEDTRAYNAMDKAYNSPGQWFQEDVKNEIKELIGYDYKDSFVCSDDTLYLDADKVSEVLRSQFVKKSEVISGVEMLRAKINSEVHNKYISICKKYDIVRYRMEDFQFDFLKGEAFSYYKVGNDFIVEFSSLRSYDFLVEISEKEFLQARLSCMA